MTKATDFATGVELQGPVLTAEGYAKQLGATVSFGRNAIVAYNFPTRKATHLFLDWLEQHNYSIKLSGLDRVEYTAPSAVSNVHVLAASQK